MKIWGYLNKFKITHAIFLSLLYLGTVYLNKIFYTQNKTKRQKNIQTLANTDINVQEFRKTQEINKNIENLEPKNLSENLINTTKNIVTIELQKSTKEMLKILDDTVIDGKIGLFRGLKGKHLCKKKLNTTTETLEKLINETIVKLETKNLQKNMLIKEKTNKFIEKTKKKAWDMHNDMTTEMRKSMGQSPQVVIDNTKKAKSQIAEFEGKIITKIAKFSEKLKEEIQ